MKKLQLSLPTPKLWKKTKKVDWDKFLQIYREPVVTYSITPNNSPEPLHSRYSKKGTGRSKYGFGSQDHSSDYESIFDNSYKSDAILNTISGLFSKFYLPERVRFSKEGIRVKLNDVVSYKIIVQKGIMKFYLTVPQRWAKNFTNAIRKDWGQVDITKVSEEIITFKPEKTKALDLQLRHHYALSIKHDGRANYLYPSLASLASTLAEDDKLLLDFMIKPLNDSWKENASAKMKAFKRGEVPSKEDTFSLGGLLGKFFDMTNIVLNEALALVDDLMGAERIKESEKEQLFDLNYSKEKHFQNAKGYDVQIRALAEADDPKKAKHILKSAHSSFENLDGDNKFTFKQIRTKRGIRNIIKSVKENKPQMFKQGEVFFEKEMEQMISIPNKTTLKEYSKIIEQDNYTRTEIHPDFLKNENDSLPFANTLDKDARRVYFGGYLRDWWTTKGRLVSEKTKLDDRSTATMIWGTQGSGKTSFSTRQALYTFGVHLSKEEWKKRSKSVVVFDVADGDIITKIWNVIPDWLRDRVKLLNHSNLKNPIPVNNSDLEEYNRTVMNDEDYSFVMAEMEAKLVNEILGSSKSQYMDRWFTTALQVAHMADRDWGYPEAIRILTDDEFRISEVIPKITDERMLLELEAYNEMREEGQTDQIVQTIQNRFVQLERDQKLWDSIAQKPLRNEDGTTKINFRKWMDGDEDGAYLVLVYIPKNGVSELYRKFLFAHYFTKIWNVALSRESGFAGREYRPETLVIIDEIHQIIDVPLVAKLFIDLFKEPRKYSLRMILTLHGWSSLAKAGRTYESKIKQSILDNGCNLIMLKGGRDAFESLENFLSPMTVQDYDNLMNMKWCGIFGIRWQNQNHVFQAKLLPPAEEETIEVEENGKKVKKPVLPKYDDWDSNNLSSYVSPYSRPKEEVRKANLERIKSMVKKSIKNFTSEENELEEDASWEDLKQDGTKEKRSRRSR